jgi:hypothetical protein
MATEKRTTEVRERAWLLIQVEQVGDNTPQEVAKALFDKFGPNVDKPWVLVRADFVTGGGKAYNTVVPVDADPDMLQSAIEEIGGEAGVSVKATLRVTHHNPDPPHACHSYVTEIESDKVPDHSVEVGRRKFASPAENAWG